MSDNEDKRPPRFKIHDRIVHQDDPNTPYTVYETPEAHRRLEDCNEPYYRYVGDKASDTHWIRRQSEMEDGRFSLLNPRKVPIDLRMLEAVVEDGKAKHVLKTTSILIHQSYLTRAQVRIFGATTPFVWDMTTGRRPILHQPDDILKAQAVGEDLTEPLEEGAPHGEDNR